MASDAPRLPPLLDPEALLPQLGQPWLAIIDLRSGPDSAALFAAGHVPGAVHSDYAGDGWRGRAGGSANVPPTLEHLSALLARLGITPEHHVVLVHAGETPSHVAMAARAGWTLAWAGHPFWSLLDGGQRGWASDPARPLATGPSRPEPAQAYPVRPVAALHSDLAATERRLAERSATLLDARAAGFYTGRERSGDVARAGRLPGALQRDYTEAVDAATGRLRPRAELEALYGQVPSGPVVSYCNTGHTAALNWFVMSRVLGRPDVSLFAGSMSEWTLAPERPVETDV